MNIQLFKDIKRAILAEPERFDMRDWIQYRPCGTVGCIAGWACLLSMPEDVIDELRAYSGDLAHMAAKLLELPEISLDNIPLLFLFSYWPADWQMRLVQTKIGSREYAQVVCDYIDFFTDGATKDEPNGAELISAADLIPIVIPKREEVREPVLEPSLSR